MALRAAFPGSFDPLTVAHVAMAEAARSHVADLQHVDLVMSLDPLGKDHRTQVPVETRRACIEAMISHVDWLGVVVVEERLVSDIAEAYDLVILGADKWLQLDDPSFYRSGEERDAARHRLRPAIVFGRRGHQVGGLRPVDTRLDLPPDLHDVSSSAVRAGRTDWQY